MAQITKSRRENVPGDFFVDSSCIDCDTCRWMAPETFSRIGKQSAVLKQPENQAEKIKAIEALISCPTASIGYLGQDLKIGEIVKNFPLLIEDNVYHCGFHAAASYGAASYFIQRKEGNILVDSPRFTPTLVNKLEEMGGVSYMFLTHKDDVADHQKFHDHFGLKRIIHQLELCDAIPDAEIVLEHSFHSKLFDSEDELAVIHTPGHTAGHLVLNYQRKFLFSGDHIWYSKNLNRLVSPKRYSDDWQKQIESVEKLIEYYWAWLLPGHGGRIKAHPEAFKIYVEKCVEEMKLEV